VAVAESESRISDPRVEDVSVVKTRVASGFSGSAPGSSMTAESPPSTA